MDIENKAHMDDKPTKIIVLVRWFHFSFFFSTYPELILDYNLMGAMNDLFEIFQYVIRAMLVGMANGFEKKVVHVVLWSGFRVRLTT